MEKHLEGEETPFPITQRADSPGRTQTCCVQGWEQIQHFPGAGNTLGTCKSIMDAENSQLQTPGSSGCTCTVSQVPWKRDGRDSCCPQGSLPKMGFSCLFYTVLLCLRFGSRYLQPGSQRGWKSPGWGFRVSCFQPWERSPSNSQNPGKLQPLLALAQKPGKH